MAIPPAPERPAPDIDPATMHRLLLHEARVHAVPGRELRILDDGILLHDPVDPEPFWNRLEGVRWPADAAGFDRRLTETVIQFAALGRQTHIWSSPLHDGPPDLAERLLANGFHDMGAGDLMVLTDPRPALETAREPLPDGLRHEVHARLTGRAAERAARTIVDVLVDAFEFDDARRSAIEVETAASLGHPWFTHHLVLVGDRPAAVARSATFEGASYLSSIGTAHWARDRGLGGLVTRLASADGLAAGSEWTYLGVYVENAGARSVYRRAGFERVGRSCPDLILIG
jgi:ribosomal protein S18 acetylase RimI-like enzyme